MVHVELAKALASPDSSDEEEFAFVRGENDVVTDAVPGDVDPPVRDQAISPRRNPGAAQGWSNVIFPRVRHPGANCFEKSINFTIAFRRYDPITFIQCATISNDQFL